MDKKKLIIIVVVAVVAALAGYKMVLAKPKDVPEPKVAGEVYVLPKEFLVNLSDGRFARLNVALELDHGYSSAVAVEEAAKAHGGGGHGAVKAPEGFGILPQEAVLRDIITDELTDATAKQIQRRESREKLKKAIAKKVNKSTDVKVHHVLFTDVAVQ
ncbi:MAG: flagellar basal body-associated FliL family protein [Solirubrobacteraceae bacterium]|nr:flagellar basal body-associated FliL family protein [Solirubrobacteraceae bacterium]